MLVCKCGNLSVQTYNPDLACGTCGGIAMHQNPPEYKPGMDSKVDPRLKYAVFYDNRYNGIAMYNDGNEAIKCAMEYSKNVCHADVQLYIQVPEMGEHFSLKDITAFIFEGKLPEKVEPIWASSMPASMRLHDSVNHPQHYTFGKFEVIDVLMDWFSTKPLLWQVGKYIARAFHKGNTLEDLKKARWYLDKQIEILENDLILEKIS